jgi:hypothetical protein
MRSDPIDINSQITIPMAGAGAACNTPDPWRRFGTP